jgi:hypothetical protein
MYLATGFKTRKCNLNAIQIKTKGPPEHVHHPATKLCIVDLWGSINLHLEALKSQGTVTLKEWGSNPAEF